MTLVSQIIPPVISSDPAPFPSVPFTSPITSLVTDQALARLSRAAR